jgi:hypothetical protein
MTADTRRFLNAAGEFLRADPARNTVILTVTEDLRVKAAASARALFGWWQPEESRSGPRSCTRRTTPSCSPG